MELAYGTDTPDQSAETGAPSLAYGDALPTAPGLSEKNLNARVARTDFALGDKSPGPDVLKDSFQNGQEGTIRQTAAGIADAEFRQEKIAHINHLQKQGVPLSGKDVEGLMAFGTTPEANPNTVIEDKFSRNFTNVGVIGDPGKNLVFQSAFDTTPESTQENINKAVAAGSRHHIVKSVLEDAEAAYKSVPWFDSDPYDPNAQKGVVGDTAIDTLTGGIAAAVVQRNLLNKAPGNSVLPGSNQLEQIQYLYLLPADQIRPALMAAAGPGSEMWTQHPKFAMDFIKAAVSFSASDAYVNNVMQVANVAGMLPWGVTGLKTIGRVVRGKEVTTAAETVQKMPSLVEQTMEQIRNSPRKTGEIKGSALSGDGMNAAQNALDVLSAPSRPVEAGYYVPEAGIGSTTYTKSKNAGQFVPDFTSTVENGVPRIFNKDGVEVQLSRTPEEGHYPVTVENQPNQTTFRTSRGSTYTVDGQTTQRDRSAGKGDPNSKKQTDATPGGLQEPSQRTIYVDKKGAEELGVYKEGVRSALSQDDKGRWSVLITSGPDAGKKYSRLVKASDEPAKGLYPIEMWNEGHDIHIGNKIVSVENNVDQRVTLGPKIVSAPEVEARIALADITKAQAQTDPVDALSKMGQHTAAAEVKATQDLKNRFTQIVQSGDAEAIRRNVPSLASPQLYYQNSSSLTTERAARLADEAIRQSSEIGAAILDPQRVERLTAESFNRAISAAKDVMGTKFNRNADAILDQATIWDSAANIYRVQTKIGKKDGTLFDSAIQANHFRTFQYRLGSSATVEQEGTKFYLSHIQDANETARGVREGLIVSENQTPRGFWNTLLSGVTGRFTQFGNSLRSSRYTQSEFQMNNRITATHAPSVLRGVLEDAAKDIEAMGGRWTTNERHELQQILEMNRDFMDVDGQRGQFYKSALEFETAFNAKFGKMPTEKQIVAYDQFTRLSDTDWILRELDWLRDKSRQGVRNYQLPYTKTEEGIPQKAKTDWFNAKKVENFDPLNTQNANVYIMPEGRFTTKFDLKKETVQDMETLKGIKEGKYQILQVYNPGSKPLRDATGIKDNIHFVVVDKFDDKAIQLGEASMYRPGGHVIYQDSQFMKQPQIGIGALGRETHFGDTTVKSFATPKEGQMWVDRYNEARELLHNNDEAGLKAYIDSGKLPETLPEFKKLFTDGGAGLSTEHPFVLTTSGRNTFQSSEELARKYPGLKDTFSSYDLTQTQDSKFLAERDQQLNTIANKGTEENPIYTNVPSRLYDPYTALQKGMGQIVRQRWMGDYKISAAESWVQEFGLLFDQSKLPIDKLRQNPVYWLSHAEGNLDVGFAKANPELYAAAMVSRKNILNFIGARDEVGAVLEGLEKKVIEGIEGLETWKVPGSGGQALLPKGAAKFADESLLPAISSVPEYSRKAAFHTVIGLFNPVQLFQQAQGLTHVLALSPVNGLKGTTASALARLYRYTEDASILENMADKAAGLGWNKDHYLEAYKAWKDSGTHTIGGETATLSTIQDPKLFASTGSKFLDKGLMFFKAGESIVRDTAYFTAYSDWRAANPTAKLDNRAMGDIGRRFDTLSMNMTRASNAVYNEGILSIPTQFWTWNARFTEQMLGKQLTAGEKARALTMYSAMYGVPATLGGITFGVIPMANYQDIREYALANGYNVSNKFYQLFSEGIPAMLTNMLSGHDTDFQRFSPNASQLKDIIDGKKSAMEMLGGASGGFVQKSMAALYPFYAYGFNAFKQDSGFPVLMNNLKSVAEVSSTFNNAEKAYVALTTGKYIGKNEQLVNNTVDTYEGLLLGMGLSPKRVSDAYAIMDYAKTQKSVQDKFSKLMTEEYKIAARAGARGDMQTMTSHMTMVQAYSAAANMTKAQEIEVFKRAMSDSTDLVDAANRFMLQNNQALQNIPAMQQYLKNLENRK